MTAIEQGHRVYFITLNDLVECSWVPRQSDRLHVVSNTLTRIDLLLLDEIGYLPLESIDAAFLFQVVSRRYEAGKSIILTSNKSYGNWHDIFPDAVLANALLGRLLHLSTTVNIRSESYRTHYRRHAGPPSANTKGG